MDKNKEEMNHGIVSEYTNTNVSCLAFEDKTDNSTHIQGFTEFTVLNKHFYPTKKKDSKHVVFIPKKYFKQFMLNKFNKKMFRIPDESYLIEYEDKTYSLIIVEKKNQINEGSVETKLWAAPSLKREYELFLGTKFKVQYIFCVSQFLKLKLDSENEKYKILNTILLEHQIPVFCGDDADYFETFNAYLEQYFES